MSVDQAEVALGTHRHEPAARRTRTELKTEMADTRYSFPAVRRAARSPTLAGSLPTTPHQPGTAQGTIDTKRHGLPG